MTGRGFDGRDDGPGKEGLDAGREGRADDPGAGASVGKPTRPGVHFILAHEPTKRRLGLYESSTEASRARAEAEQADPEGAARGDYRIYWTLIGMPPPEPPHRFKLAYVDGTFGPICRVCGPAMFGSHTNPEDVRDAFNRF